MRALTLTVPLPKVRYTGLPPCRGFAFPATLAPATAQLVAGGGVLFGWAVEETTGLAGARVVVGDGTSSGINIGVPITLQSSESTRDFLPSGGMVFQQGIAFNVTSGTVAGTVFAVLLDPDVIDALADPRRSDYE